MLGVDSVFEALEQNDRACVMRDSVSDILDSSLSNNQCPNEGPHPRHDSGSCLSKSTLLPYAR